MKTNGNDPMSDELFELAESAQCDAICAPDFQRVVGDGVYCTACDGCVQILTEDQCQSINAEKEE